MVLFPGLLLLASAGAAWEASVDLPLTLGAGALTAGLVLGVQPGVRGTQPVEGPLLPLDRPAPGRWDPAADRASDGLLALAGAVAAGTALLQGGEAAGLEAESLSLTLLATEGLKLGIQRPRPYTRLEAPPPEVRAALDSPDAWLSFPSGHAAVAAVLALSSAGLLAEDGLPPLPLYAGAVLLAGSVAWLRVEAGQHYPTDVLAGLALGAAASAGVQAAHRGEGLALLPLPRGLALAWTARPTRREAPRVSSSL